jgi:chemotaxis signal transduction protein
MSETSVAVPESARAATQAQPAAAQGQPAAAQAQPAAAQAQPAAAQAQPAAAQAYILFGVAGTTYAIRSQDVLHIEMIEHVTPVPNAPAFVEGVVFSRGQVVPVINLRARFGFERGGVTLRSRLLVVQHAARRIGLLVDESREFIRISDAAIKPPQDAIGGLSGSYLDGVATLGQRIVLVLSVRDIVEAVPTAVA